MNVNWNADKEGKINGTTTDVTLKGESADGKSKLKLEGSDVTFEKEITPAAWKTDDWNFGLKFIGTSKPKDTLFQWTTEARFGFPKLTKDFGLGGSASIRCGSDKKLIGQGTIVAKLLQDHFLGVTFGRDIKGHENTSLELAAFSKLNDDLTTFGVWDQFKKSLTFGGAYKINNFIDRGGLVANFDLNRDKDGNLGSKKISVIAEKKLDDNTTLRLRSDVENSVVVTAVLTTKVTDNFKLRIADTLDPIAAYTNKNLKTYGYGVSADFEF